jgi:2-keto-3-deoxy-L-rhamnonate aldolase RhmA
MVEVSAHVGVARFMVDRMFSANDGQRTEELVTAGRAAGITPVVRLQSFPRLGYAHRVPLEVSRASGAGARHLLVAAAGTREIDESLRVARDRHHRLQTMYRGGPGAEAAAQVIPHLEAHEALESTDAMMEHPAVKLVFIAATHTLRELIGEEHPDVHAPPLWEYIDRAVALGRRRRVVVGANTGFAGSLDEMRRRAELLHEHGGPMIMLQGGAFLLHLAATDLLAKLAPLR